MSTAGKRLYRSRDDKMIAGVCGGLAAYLGLDPTIVRILYIVVSVLSAAFPGIIVYIVLAIVMPQEPLEPPAPQGGGTAA